ncbi:MAG: triose-phosphate isomerase [Planctomycetes bacterium]|nr:triose-phosphate isomerase [Planctomycetota bacterium]
MTRRAYLAGNWKMHLDRGSIAEFCEATSAFPSGEGAPRVGLFPPAVYLAETAAALRGSEIVVGAQTARPEDHGAFTGEVAMRMVRDVGATAVIVGHSERRHVFGETDADVRARVDAALALGLEVVLCVGETLDERERDETATVVLRQLDAGLSGIDGATVAEAVTVAYEPVWAIGTGRTASPGQAQEVHALVRARLAETHGEDVAAHTIIQYGGSVKPGNIAELLACPDVDGALVGGASLDPASFAAIVAAGVA